MTDAARHTAGKKLVRNFDCYRAYHCLQMAVHREVGMLALNSAHRTARSRKLAQRLRKSLSTSSSFMRKNSDPILRADQCAQYVDDIGIAADSHEQLIINLRVVFKCIQNAGLKLSMTKSHFGAKKSIFFGRTVIPNGINPQKQKITEFLVKVKFPRSRKHYNDTLAFWIVTAIINHVQQKDQALLPTSQDNRK